MAAQSFTTTDNEGLDDSGFFVNIGADQLGLTDSANPGIIQTKVLQDSEGLVDSITAFPGKDVILVDSLGMDDSATLELQLDHEMMGLVDSLSTSSNNSGRTMTDPMGLVDTTEDIQFATELVQTDAMGMTDSGTWVGGSSGRERVNMTDSIVTSSPNTAQAQTLTDNLGLTDNVLGFPLMQNRSLTDQVGLTDSISPSMTAQARSVIDPEGLSDSMLVDRGGPLPNEPSAYLGSDSDRRLSQLDVNAQGDIEVTDTGGDIEVI
jgi:hypothetical protein